MTICLITTSRTDYGETARRKYVYLREFIFGQFENFKFSCAQLSLRIFKMRHGRCFSLPKIIPVRFFILQVRYRNPKRQTYRKKSKCTPSQPFCASIYAFSRTPCVLCLYNNICILFRKREWGLRPSLRSGAVTLKALNPKTELWKLQALNPKTELWKP